MSKERLVWCDVLRLFAFILLLGCHAADPFNAAATYGVSGETVAPEFLTWGARWGALVRPCVPLFVMLTGILSLPVVLPMEAFYRKRLPRVLWPFLIWSVIYYLTPWFTGVIGLDKNVVFRLFCWAETDSQALSVGLANVARIPYTFNFIACHMWYIYMLVGLYFYLPVFSAWVERATKRQKEIVLVLWGLSTFLPYFTEFVSRYAFGTCEWNSFGLFYYFAGFSGYMLLGHYLSLYVHPRPAMAFAVAFVLVATGFAMTLTGYEYILSLPEKTPEQIELFWTYNTPNVALMTVGWYLLARLVPVKPGSRVARLLANLTVCGFGIYMVHYFFVRLGYDVVTWLHLPAALCVPVSALIILVSSWIVVAAGRRLLGRYSVYFWG